MKSILLVVLLMVFPMFVATADAGDSPTSRPAGAKVAILPFVSQGASPPNWAAPMVQQAIYDALMKSSLTQPILTPDGGVPEASAALDAGKKLGADFVIFGNLQFLGDNLRANGQIVSAQSGKSIGSLSAMGFIHDLFAIEDDLSGQASRRLAHVVAPPLVTPAEIPAAYTYTPGVTLDFHNSTYFDGSPTWNSPVDYNLQFSDDYTRYYYDMGQGSGYSSFGIYPSFGFIGPIGSRRGFERFGPPQFFFPHGFGGHHVHGGHMHDR